MGRRRPGVEKGDPLLRYDRSEAFWRKASDEYWQREPFVFEVDPAAAPFEEGAVFDALASDVEHDRLDWIQLALTDSPTNLRDYRMTTFRKHGPQASDGGFAGYFERLSKLSFGLNVHDLDRRNPTLGGTSEVFDEHFGVHPRSPIPRRWELDAFVGNYPATPFGIHRDNAGVFSFCLVGQRTVMLWPEDYFEPGHPDLTRPDPRIIARHAEAATRIRLEPGLGAYWPPGNWHVVLSDGNPFAVAQVSAYFDQADLGR